MGSWIAGAIHGQCRRFSIQKHLQRHAADAQHIPNFPTDAVLLGPQPDRVSTLPDGLSVSDKAANVIVKQDTVAPQQS
jgi:hypothetical protein